ncbi:MAG: LemA family protein [Candidatus Pacebacteria bacterium]|nr:LemA family protein [Candidatus Paceibacterota bacterium]
MNVGYIILIIVIFIGLWFIGAYNSFIKRRNRVQESWSDIEVQLKRRYNLIPNLVETVKGYASHEKGIFENVTQARARALQAESIQEKANAERELTGALKSLFAVAENYPNLRASENFQKLQDELTDTEDKIQAARRFYNGNVRDYNTSLEVFPNNIVASLFNFKKAEFFELEEEEKEEARKAPDVKF